jgi:hypothetical protein
MPEMTPAQLKEMIEKTVSDQLPMIQDVCGRELKKQIEENVAASVAKETTAWGEKLLERQTQTPEEPKTYEKGIRAAMCVRAIAANRNDVSGAITENLREGHSRRHVRACNCCESQ